MKVISLYVPITAQVDTTQLVHYLVLYTIPVTTNHLYLQVGRYD